MADEDYKRKLTSILSADVKGYTLLMADNEIATIETIASDRGPHRMTQRPGGRFTL